MGEERRGAEAEQGQGEETVERVGGTGSTGHRRAVLGTGGGRRGQQGAAAGRR